MIASNISSGVPAPPAQNNERVRIISPEAFADKEIMQRDEANRRWSRCQN
jgi:hypothetical protein